MENRKLAHTNTLSNRSFGLIFSLIFFIIFIFCYFVYDILLIWTTVVASTFLFFGLLVPSALYFPNKIWYKFSLFLGSTISKIIMLLIYFLAVVPTGLVIKILNKDLLKLKFEKNINTYWLKKNDSESTLKDQF